MSRRAIGRVRRLPAGAVLGGAAALASVAVLVAGRGTTFLIDEWSFVMTRVGFDSRAFLAPHNEHIAIVQALVFKLLFAVVGLGRYWPYRVVLLVSHLACVVLLFQVMRRKTGEWIALSLALPILLLGTSSPVLFYGIDVAWTVPMAGLLGIMLLLDRKTRVADAASAALLVVALASFTLGLCIAAGVVVALLWDRDRWRRIWVAAVPVAAYALWYGLYNRDPAHQGPLAYSRSALTFAHHVATSAVSGLLGLSLQDPGVRGELMLVRGLRLLTIVLGALALVMIVRRRSRARDLAMLLTVAGSFWVLLGITRAYEGIPGAYVGRYVYVGAVLLALVVADLVGKRHIASWAWAPVVAVVIVSLGANGYWLFHYGDERRHVSRQVAVRLGALEVARAWVGRDAIPAGFRPDYTNFSSQVYAEGYFDALDRLRGSPGLSAKAIAASSEADRAIADDVIARAAGQVVPLEESRPAARSVGPDAGVPAVDEIKGGSAVQVGRCVVVRPNGGATPVLDVSVPVAGMTVGTRRSGSVSVRLRRFATSFDHSRAQSFDGVPASLRVPSGGARGTWHARLTGASTAFALTRDRGREVLARSTFGVSACAGSARPPTDAIPSGPVVRVPVVPGAGRGYVEHVAMADGGISVVGWAAGPTHRAAERVVVLVGGRVIGSVPPTLVRPDVAAAVGADVVCGFQLRGPLPPTVLASGRTDVRVLAVIGGRAYQLARLG